MENRSLQFSVLPQEPEAFDAECGSEDCELMSGPQQFIKPDRCRRRTGAALSLGALLLASACVARMFSSNYSGLHMQPQATIEKVDAKLKHEVKRFRISTESAEVAESLKEDEGKPINPLYSPDRLGFTKEELDMYRQAFDEFDENKDGAIDAKELKLKLKELHMHDITDKDIDLMIEEADKFGNNNDKIEFAGFCNLMKRAHEQGLKVEKAVFEFYDLNKDRNIESKEAWKRQEELQEGGDREDQMSTKEVEDVIRSVDMNANGKDSEPEFGVVAE